MQVTRPPRSRCPISCALELAGDKWTLLVARDLFRGRKTYGELLDSPEGIPTNILADRLRRMEASGLIESSPYQERPVRYAYALTEKGRALEGVLRAVAQWGRQCVPGARVMPEFKRKG